MNSAVRHAQLKFNVSKAVNEKAYELAMRRLRTWEMYQKALDRSREGR